MKKRYTNSGSLQSLSWTDFADAVALFVNKIDRIRDLFATPEEIGDIEAFGANVLVSSMGDLTRKTEDGEILEHLLGIETLVSTLLYFDTSKPHDVIFSLLALSRDTPQRFCALAQPISGPMGAPFSITVDYKTDPVELFVEFTKLCVRTSKALDIVCRHWAPDIAEDTSPGKKKEIPLPSWIKKLSNSTFGKSQDALQGRRSGDSLVGCPYRDSRKPYNASNGSEAIYHFGPPTEEMLEDMENQQMTRDFLDDPMLLRSDLHRLYGSRRPSIEPPKDWASYVPKPGVSKSQTMPNTDSLDPKALYDRGAETPILLPNLIESMKVPDAISDRMLHVKGKALATIRKRSFRIQYGIIPSEWLQAAGWKPEKPAYLPEKLWRTLVADRGPDGLFPPMWYRRACLHCLNDPALMGANGDLDTRKKPSSDIMAQFLSRVRSVVWSRQFFLAGEKNEYFGLSPFDAERGDLICVLAGCTVPVVLHPKKVVGNTTLCYELTGEAFVYGKMDGEVMADLSCTDSEKLAEELQYFTLV